MRKMFTLKVRMHNVTKGAIPEHGFCVHAHAVGCQFMKKSLLDVCNLIRAITIMGEEQGVSGEGTPSAPAQLELA